MAKALVGYLTTDPRNAARIAAENHRLRMRVTELEGLVLRLSEENDLLTARAADLLDLEPALQEMQPA